MLHTLKHFLTRGYTLFIVSLFIFTFSILKVSAIYYPTDNITNPTCAPGDSGCYVSLLPDQTSKSGSLLFTNGSNPVWSNPSGMSWDNVENTLSVKRVLRLGNNTVTPNGYGSALHISGNADYSTPNFTYEPFITAQPFGVQFVTRVQRANGTPSAPTAVLAGQIQYSIQLSPYGTSGYTIGTNNFTMTSLSDATTGSAPAIRYGLTTSPSSADTGLFVYPQGALIANNITSYLTTPTARLQVNGSGATSATYTAQFHNSTGTNNSLVIRDDGNIGVGTATPAFQFHMVGSAPNMTVQRYSDGTTPPVFRGWKSRGTTSSPSPVLSGDGLASFIGGGYDSVGSFDTASIQIVAAENFTGSSNRGTYISFNTNAIGTAASSGGVERMRVSDSGNVGIGTSSPLSRFHINKASTVNSSPTYPFEPLLRLTEDQSNSAAEIAMESSNGQGGISFSRSVASGGVSANSGIFRLRISGSTGIGTHSSINQILSVGASENWTPTANGIRILFSPIVTGTTSLASMLAINGDGVTVGTDAMTQPSNRFLIRGRGTTSSTNSLTIQNSAVSTIFNVRDDGYMTVGVSSLSGIVSRFQNSTGTCDINPTTTSLSCSSDRTLKTNITNLNNTTLNQITSLKPVTYTWINDTTNQQQTGFIAQDVEQIFPNLVYTDPNTNLKSLNYIGLIPYAIEGIKELDIKLNQLSSLDTTLQGSFAFLLKEVLGNVSNGINELYVKVVKSDRVETKELCIDGLCITKAQLQQMLDESNQSAVSNAPAPDSNSPTEITEETVVNSDESSSENTDISE